MTDLQKVYASNFNTLQEVRRQYELLSPSDESRPHILEIASMLAMAHLRLESVIERIAEIEEKNIAFQG